jgi:hypothetical protein
MGRHLGDDVEVGAALLQLDFLIPGSRNIFINSYEIKVALNVSA